MWACTERDPAFTQREATCGGSSGRLVACGERLPPKRPVRPLPEYYPSAAAGAATAGPEHRSPLRRWPQATRVAHVRPERSLAQPLLLLHAVARAGSGWARGERLRRVGSGPATLVRHSPEVKRPRKLCMLAFVPARPEVLEAGNALSGPGSGWCDGC